jgi:hypothetical protein
MNRDEVLLCPSFLPHSSCEFSCTFFCSPRLVTALGSHRPPLTGVGTYGEVRYARCTATNRAVAIKIVDLGRFRNEAAAIMKKEIQILRQARHENVIAIIDVKENIKYRGTWCASCACTTYEPMPGGGGQCQNCSPHDGGQHSGTRQPRSSIPITGLM